jgi:hypothetical protein
MQLLSDAFESAGTIPRRHTCDGENLSPPLRWRDVPRTARSLALVVEDPDAPTGHFTHWLVYNLPVDFPGLPEGVSSAQSIPAGGVQGTNSFGQIGYGGPCPPRGTHRYNFRLFALDGPVDLPPGATRDELLDAIDPHILDSTELLGHFSRGRG